MLKRLRKSVELCNVYMKEYILKLCIYQEVATFLGLLSNDLRFLHFIGRQGQIKGAERAIAPNANASYSKQ